MPKMGTIHQLLRPEPINLKVKQVRKLNITARYVMFARLFKNEPTRMKYIKTN